MFSSSKTAQALLIALLTASAGCDESYVKTPLDPPREDAKLVAYGFFHPGEPWHVFVSRSAPLSGGDLDGVANATVDVYQGSTLVERLSFWTENDQAWYRGQTAPVQGQTYALKVSAPSLPALEGSGSTPAPVVPRVVSVRYIGASGTGMQYRTYDLEMEIPDPAGPSFYRLWFGSTVNLGDQDRDIVTLFCSSDPLLRQTLVEVNASNGTACFHREGALFSGESFDGQTRRITVRLNTFESYDQTLHLEHLSEDAYRFERTRRLAELVDGNPFAEPLDLYTNLRGGLGVFAGHTETQVTVVLPP